MWVLDGTFSWWFALYDVPFSIVCHADRVWAMFACTSGWKAYIKAVICRGMRADPSYNIHHECTNPLASIRAWGVRAWSTHMWVSDISRCGVLYFNHLLASVKQIEHYNCWQSYSGLSRGGHPCVRLTNHITVTEHGYHTHCCVTYTRLSSCICLIKRSWPFSL